MKIIIAPDSYKESLSALAVAEGIEAGFRAIFPHAHYHLIPMADGGEGTVDALLDGTEGERIVASVTDPLGRKIEASYGILGDGKRAIIEMAVASGLALIEPEKRNPLITTSYGTGELILDALNRGIRHIILAIGGSATNDGGAGMMEALGLSLQDHAGETLAWGGAALANLATINCDSLDPRLASCQFEIACDVDNPLIGKNGASYIFGGQKGADGQMMATLDHALTHYAMLVEAQLGIAIAHQKGAGAAGGLGAAALAFLGGRLRPGVELVMEALNLAEAVADADLVITGEGRMDGQTRFGKTPMGVAMLAKRYNKPVIAIVGALGEDAEMMTHYGIDALFSITREPTSLKDAYERSRQNLEVTAKNVAIMLKLGREI